MKKTQILRYISPNNLPQTNNQSVKYIPSITDIFSYTISSQLNCHLNGEDAAEGDVADLHQPGEGVWLVMVLYAHHQSVQCNTHTDTMKENVVFDHEPQIFPHG